MKSISTRIWFVVLSCALSFYASSQTNHLVISQLFGSGGVSASLPSNDFIELYNPTGTTVQLNGWSVQFTFGSATTYVKIPLSGYIMAKAYYLIQLGRDNYYAGTTMPQVDLTYNYNINSPDMKIGLYNFNTSVTGANPSAVAIDFVGTGTATGYETTASPQGAYNVSLMCKASATSTIASMSTTGAEYRSGNGYDTNNNSVDLLLTPNVVARSANSNPLAVSFLSLDLIKTGTTNNLRWQIASSGEANSFAVEKSVDGLRFSSIAQVNSQTGSSYQFADASTVSAYYRIKSVSKNGELHYSTTVFAEGRASASLKLYPTLVSSSLVLQIPANGKGGTVSVYMANGALQQQTAVAEKQTQLTLSMSSLKPGTYLLQYTSAAGETQTERFVKAG